RSLCKLGNTNCAISSECRTTFLMCIDPKLNNLATSEVSPAADGMLFGAPLVKELSKFCFTYSLEKAQISLNLFFKQALLLRAGRYGGCMPGRGSRESPQAYYPKGRGRWYGESAETTFYFTRSRGGRSRFHRAP
ncbi:hypothetical protein NDU88_006163, partial [Pleurodeles waltl]